MKNAFLIALVFYGLFLLNSCENKNEDAPEVPQSVVDKSLDLFSGEVIEKKIENEEGIDAWEIKIQNTSGSVVQFYWATSNQSLIKIEGTQEPFDYDLSPGSGLINFSVAKTFAVSAVKNNAVTKWELKQEDDFIDKWVYTFEIDDDGATTKIYIDAENGDVLQID